MITCVLETGRLHLYTNKITVIINTRIVRHKSLIHIYVYRNEVLKKYCHYIMVILPYSTKKLQNIKLHIVASLKSLGIVLVAFLQCWHTFIPTHLKKTSFCRKNRKKHRPCLPCIINGGLSTRVQSPGISSIDCQQLCL